MRWSRTFIPTLKETPSDAEITSHKLMLRAGLMRKVTAGAYAYLPLGLKALKKAEQIVREEMDRAGAIEILMPAIQPSELWAESGRLQDYGPDLVTFTDRHNRELVFGPTHEEVVTDIVRNHISSYRQLPVNLYQIQTKFRDEIRPRFGVLRSKEFIMKDAYSFNPDDASLEESYQAMYKAYSRICERAGLPYVVVEAASGAIGGDVNHEFVVPCDVGEAVIATCGCGYAANVERAAAGQPPKEKGTAAGDMEDVDTPGCTTIAQVSEFLKVEPKRLIKTLIFLADGKPIAALVRGDHELNEVKLLAAAGASGLALADAATIERVTKAPVGFAGPVGLAIPLYVDHAVAALAWGATGANKADAHTVNVVPGRDFAVEKAVDIHAVTEGDLCPKCGKPLAIGRGIEMGHIFKLGSKYSKAMGATFLDEKGQERIITMGCYGIGINRIVAAMIETSFDEKGIIWKMGVAPFHVEILAVDMRDEEVTKVAESLQDALEAAGVEVLYDDREATAGVKFNDADLIGLPIRVTVGRRALDKGGVELKMRDRKEVEILPLDSAAETISELVQSALAEAELPRT